jgi:prevent-host-death family protein
MRKLTISVTDAARNFADCVNRAHYQHVTFILVKNGSPVARLIPDGEKKCTGPELAEALRRTELPPDEAAAWQRDIKAGHKRLKAPKDKWA